MHCGLEHGSVARFVMKTVKLWVLLNAGDLTFAQETFQYPADRQRET
jgi:hypothetical protein